MPPKAKEADKRRAPAKTKLPEEFPPGEVLMDTGRKCWKIGAPIGQGGFGLIYLAEEDSSKKVGLDARYVVKVEPSESGPLFCELHFYMRTAKPTYIQKWVKSHGLKHLGVPRFWALGQHNKGGKSYRFIVIDRLGIDLQKKFEECHRRFPKKLVLQLGLRMLDILEFIHQHEYVHADIKASNIMLSNNNLNQVFLADFGLAFRYAPNGVVKDYKDDPKRCHDGTIEFTSIDAHKGASPSRRGDLEILSYCMVQWLCGRLPWEDNLQNPVYVRDCKISCWENISGLMKQCFSSQEKPVEIQMFMEEVKRLNYKDEPPYDKLRAILRSGLKAMNAADEDELDFASVEEVASTSSQGSTHSLKEHTTRKRKLDADESDANDIETEVKKHKKVAPKKGVKQGKFGKPQKATSTRKGS